MAKIRITLEIEATPWSRERLIEEAGFEGEDAEPDTEIDAQGIGECIAAYFDGGIAEEALAGSMIFADLSDAHCVDAAQVPA